MSCIASKRAVIIATLALTLNWPCSAFAVEAEPEAAVVARLYRDFAWQAIASQPALFGNDVSHQRRAVLEKYFDRELVELLSQNAICEARSRGICNLDFDLLFDSQDPAVTDLDVKTIARGKVSVEFKNPVTQEKTQIEFHVAITAGKWKIRDIIYRGQGQPSLKQILSKKIQ